MSEIIRVKNTDKIKRCGGGKKHTFQDGGTGWGRDMMKMMIVTGEDAEFSVSSSVEDCRTVCTCLEFTCLCSLPQRACVSGSGIDGFLGTGVVQ